MIRSNTTSKPLLFDKNYFLIGFMGTGKSHWGKLWAVANKLTFVDLDVLIENEEHINIAEIFDTKGEDYFRKLEKEVLRKCGELKNTLIACGGGTPCFFDNMAWMNKQGITIWLDEPLAVIAARLAPEKAHRPLIANLSDSELIAFLENQRASRLPYYSAAQIHLQEDTITADSFKKALAKL
jgi:shikimate kinase